MESQLSFKSTLQSQCSCRLMYQKSIRNPIYLSCIFILISTRVENLPRNVSKVEGKTFVGKLRKIGIYVTASKEERRPWTVTFDTPESSFFNFARSSSTEELSNNANWEKKNHKVSFLKKKKNSRIASIQ